MHDYLYALWKFMFILDCPRLYYAAPRKGRLRNGRSVRNKYATMQAWSSLIYGLESKVQT